MKKLLKTSLIVAAAVFGLTASSHAQTVVLNGLGSSAIFLQLGQAAEAPTTAGGLGATCLFTASSGVTATDTSSGTARTDTGQSWIAWTPGTAGDNTTCGSVSGSTNIYAYLQTDSVVGDRCLFNGYNSGTCNISNTLTTTTATANKIYPTGTTIGSTEIANLPSGVITALNSATTPTFAGTDIRPEDAEFAATRALTPCGTAITQYTSGAGNATQYLGLGYSPTSTTNYRIVGYTGSTFNVLGFSLPSAFAVTPLGATPIVVAVNGQSSGTAGFRDSNITNLNRSTLALYLDGSIGNTNDAVTPGKTPSGADTNATVFVREPLSGTYNTMEYNIPNNVEFQTSQDVGSAQPSAAVNCSGTVPAWNASGVALGTLYGNAKERAIGTGQELSQVFSTADSLGYAFWSAANFASAPATSKYLTVDGVDPLGTGTAGQLNKIPTSANGLLSSVTLAHVADGTYPIWSLLRLVTAGSTTAPSAITTLASAAQSFVTATHPDFVPYSSSTYSIIGNLAVERAHFTPPGIYASGSAPALQNSVNGTFTEAGGDVGGVVIPYAVDTDYCTAVGSGSCTAGNSLTGTTAPSSLRRQ